MVGYRDFDSTNRARPVWFQGDAQGEFKTFFYNAAIPAGAGELYSKPMQIFATTLVKKGASMFSQITQYRDDPIEGFQARFMASNNPDKLDLGLGVYRNEQGEVVVFDVVIQSEQRLVAQRGHKGYRSPLGNRLYVEQMERLLFGDLLDARRIQGVVSAQTPGAGAACRVAAKYVKSLSPNSRVWASLPNWGHQIEFFGHAGLDVKHFPYYDVINAELLFDRTLATLQEQARRGDVVLLHACCHKPTGADPSLEQWARLADLCAKKGLLPFVDIAYQGFGDGIEDDLKGMFSCLPVSAQQQAYMETERGVFMLPGARMNFAALAQSNVERVARAFLEARALSSAAVA